MATANLIEFPHHKESTDIAVLSPSQVSTFLDCPAKWAFKYLENLPDPVSGLAVRGKAVHALVTWFLTGKMIGYAPDETALNEAWNDIWERESADAEFGEDEDIDELRASGLQLALYYISTRAAAIQPAAVEMAVEGEIAGIPVRGFIDILTVDGEVIDLKMKSRKPAGVTQSERLQLATYARLAPEASGQVRIDAVVATKAPQMVTAGYAVGESDERLIERIYPAAARGMRAGFYHPNRGSTLCSRKYCAFADRCEAEFGGSV